MAFNDGFYWYKNVLKKQLKLASRIYISIAIVLAPIFLMSSANASTLAGGSGWREASTVANGVGVTVNGAKDIIVNGAKKTVTGVANVTPTASQVGKFMGKNLGAAAVVGAVDLLLDGVDWVIDEGGNVNKRDTGGSFGISTSYSGCSMSGRYSSYGAITDAYAKCGHPVKNCTSTVNSYGWTIYTCGSTQFVNYATPTEISSPINDSEGRPLTLATLGQRVLDQAETEVKTGNPAVPIASPVTQAAATAVVGEAATDETQARPITAELDKSVVIPTEETAVGEISPPTTNPETGEVSPSSISLDFPVFCSWAPSMCVLADKVQEAITDARDWATSEPQEKEPENLDFEDLEIDASDVNLSASSTCPQDSVSFSVMGKSVTLDMPYQPVCDALNFFKPAVLLAGAVASVYIVSGVRTKEEDQP